MKNNGKEQKECLSKERVNAKDGCFDVAYGGRADAVWFVKVKPAFGIEKILFSFVRTNTKGEGFDIYMSMRTFRGWAIRIQRGDFFADLEKEKAAGQKYPSCYKYETGKNGSKKLGFMLSDTPGKVVINARAEGTPYVNIAVEYAFLENLAYDFLEASKEAFRMLLADALSVSRSYEELRLSNDDAECGEHQLCGQMSGAGAEQPPVPMKEVEADFFWCVKKGSAKEKRDKDGSAVVLRLVTNALAKDEPGILPTSPEYQLVDCVFHDNAVKKANMEGKWKDWMQWIDEGVEQFKISKLEFKVSDIKNGYRQLVF